MTASTEAITTRLHLATAARVRELARSEARSVSGVIRLAVEGHLAQLEPSAGEIAESTPTEAST